MTKKSTHLFEWKFINHKNYSTNHFKNFEYFKDKIINSENQRIDADLNCISYRISEINISMGLGKIFNNRITVLVITSEYFTFPKFHIKEADFLYFQECFEHNPFIRHFRFKFPKIMVESIGESILIYQKDKNIDPESYGILLSFARTLMTEVFAQPTVRLNYSN